MGAADFKSLVVTPAGEINFDNAATTPPFTSVLARLEEFAPFYSSIHRGSGKLSRAASGLFEDARLEILDFVGGDPSRDLLIHVKNTTEAINKLSNRLAGHATQNVVLSTKMEHHSNDLPWRRNFEVHYVEVDGSGRLLLDDLEGKLKKYGGRVRLVAVTGASNVTGYINPVHCIAQMAHRHGAEIFVDGAQLIPHAAFAMGKPETEERIDYLAFSGHKLYAPFGAGALVVPGDSFRKERGMDYSGGGTALLVTEDTVIWDAPPRRDEAGTPNLMGVLAMSAAVKTLKKVGMQNIARHETELAAHAYGRLEKVPRVELFADGLTNGPRIGVIPFNMDGIFHEDLALLLADEAGIAVRSGCFCAQPYIQKLLKIPPSRVNRYAKNPDAPRPGMVRVSFGLYNSAEEIDALVDFLSSARGERK